MHLILFFLFSLSALAGEPRFAEIIKVRGQVIAAGKFVREKEWLPEGASVKTERDGFVQLRLPDGSLVHLAHSSSLELRQSPKEKVPLFHVVVGKIRAVVPKSPAAKSEKLIVTTKTAVMGIRGTDFTVSFDPDLGLTSLLTVEGEVAMVEAAEGVSPEEQLARGVQMVAGGNFLVLGQPVSFAQDAPVPSAKLSGEVERGGGHSRAGAANADGEVISSSQESSTRAGLSAPGKQPEISPTKETPFASKGAKPQKVPVYFVEELKKDKDAFSSIDSNGNVMILRASDPKIKP